MKYIELFGGIGGFSYGIKKATRYNRGVLQRKKKENIQESCTNIEKRQTRIKSWQCVGYYEIDKYAVQTYNKNFGTSYEPKDIRQIRSKEIPDFDMLCAGFPCQAFSIAGKREGFKDTRGTLFFEIARIAKAKKPDYLLLENVKGLLNHDKGKTFRVIIQTLDELGYDIEWMVLNSKNFGVPQNRERVFIIGCLRGKSRPKVFPITQSSQGNLKYSAGVVSAREKWLKGGKNYSREFSQGQRIYSDKGISQTLAGNAGGQGGKTGLYATGISATYHKGDNRKSNKSGRTLIVKNNSIRRLTPTECERLQGFPDGWTEGVSDTQRYKQLGNAVTTNVIEAIIRRMDEVLLHS